MKILIQRVKTAKVSVGDKNVADINKGFLLLVGVAKDDTSQDIEKLSKRIVNLRIFEDDNGKMNLDITQVKGQILSVPQFTLYADTRKGNRPGFDLSAAPDVGKEYWSKFNGLLRDCGIDVKEGIFGAHMEVHLINDGPVTILLDSKS